jgi:hypothetical protein
VGTLANHSDRIEQVSVTFLVLEASNRHNDLRILRDPQLASNTLSAHSIRTTEPIGITAPFDHGHLVGWDSQRAHGGIFD